MYGRFPITLVNSTLYYYQLCMHNHQPCLSVQFIVHLLHCVVQASKVEKKRAEAKASSGWFGWFTSSGVEEEKSAMIPSGEAYNNVYR